MDKLTIGIAILFLLALSNATRKGYGTGEQDHGFVEVRTGAHMFYWLYYTTANVRNCFHRPLAIWLQGGPGVSSTGYANFIEIGPIDLNGNYRKHTLVKDMNVLFIDNPVGTGFSYVENTSLLTANNKQIAKDLITFMKSFYKLHPEFTEIPLHIFGESYGGKMAPEFALELYKEIQKGAVRSNLKSVVMGDPWASPVDTVNSWAPFLFNTGIIDDIGYTTIKVEAEKTEELTKKRNWMEAFTQMTKTTEIISTESEGVDFFNIITPTLDKSLNSTTEEEETYSKLTKLMRNEVSKALSIPSHIEWGSQAESTHVNLRSDIMKPVVRIVEELLNNTNVQVGVFSGQLDLICATPGTVDWINKMHWIGKEDYVRAPREGILVNNTLEGYSKETKKFSMFWINRAGHIVPKDSPAGLSFVLKKFLHFD